MLGVQTGSFILIKKKEKIIFKIFSFDFPWRLNEEKKLPHGSPWLFLWEIAT